MSRLLFVRGLLVLRCVQVTVVSAVHSGDSRVCGEPCARALNVQCQKTTSETGNTFSALGRQHKQFNESLPTGGHTHRET